ncbi:tetracycline resistance protein, class H isoform X2 [Belonocnema kinseyi]|uniref:tetracycline resistance protein, class H isoform X2 n=1 Tax=Belonocnema kinseyi TaxID=2817044 RepID=UPI00143DCDF1|nr:tetracycline resistance protein, class H isoform X2 [Belonocnema kinseyi]
MNSAATPGVLPPTGGIPPSKDVPTEKEVSTWKTMSLKQKWNFFTSNITVEPMVACYIMPSVLASLATQNLNLEKACRVNLAYSDEVCSALAARNTSGLAEQEMSVQQLVAGMQTWKTALQSGLPTILILFLGAWSDRTGLRKPCMLLPIVGEFLTSISLIACTYWFYELPMEAAGLSEALWPALTGGWFTMFMAIFSYIGDITSVESRTLRIGFVNVFLSLGVPVGMALSGILYIKIGFYGVFAISTVCYVLSFVYGLVVIKEAPRPVILEKDKNDAEKRSACGSALHFFSLKHIAETFRVAFKKGENNRQKRVAVLMIIVMVIVGPMYGEMAVMYLFMRYRFNWNEVQFSMFSTYSMVTNLIGTAISVGVFSHVLKIDDAVVGIMSCMSKILSSFVYAFATTNSIIYLGKVNSLFGVCESLMPLVYGPMYSFVYRATMDTFPGAFFILGGVLTSPAVFAFLWLYKEHRQDRIRLEKKEAAEKMDKGDGNLENNLSMTKITNEVEKVGIDNEGFESEKL